ncbi:MAG: hypothetical protein U9Q04_04510 [Campylobacterota bacterium]|nr:hypothetical protein [Campylobacterota bacterium]
MFGNLKETLKNSEFNDIKLELRNLSEDDLLNKAAAQQLLIKDLEKAHIEHIDEIVELKERLEDLTKEKYSLILKNERLEQSLMAQNN